MRLLDIPSRIVHARPYRRQAGWIGIDIGTRSIKIAQVELREGRIRLASHIVVANQENQRLEEHSISSGWISQAVRNGLSARRGFHGNTAACTLSMSAVDLRTIELTAGSEEDRSSLIAKELGDAEPFEFDAWNVPASDDEKASRRREVNIMAVRRALADSVAESLFEAGLDCEVLDGMPFALARAVLPPMPSHGDRTSAVLDWGDSTATISIVRDGCPLYVRRLRDSGLNRVTQAVCRNFDVTRQECGLLLSTYGLPAASAERSGQPHELPQMIGQTVSEPIQQVVSELRRTLSYLQSQRPDLLPDQIWLCGGGAQICNVADHLAGRLGFPVENWRPDPQFDPGDAPMAILAAAVALSRMAWSR